MASYPLPEVISGHISGLRRLLRAWLVVDGASLLAGVAAAIAFLSLALDYFLHMDRHQRTVYLVLSLMTLAHLAYRRLLRPLALPLPDESLCLRVESRHRELGEALISAVQFCALPAPLATGVSAGMVGATIERGVREARAIDFRDVVDIKRRNQNLLRGGAALALATAAFLLLPAVTSLWFQRNVLLRDIAWPRKTHLVILGARDGVLTSPRGDDLELRAKAEGVIPAQAHVEYGPLDGRDPVSEQMPRLGANIFRMNFRNVLKPFRFRVRGGDDVTAWFEVRLLERPAISSLALIAMPPAYTGLKPQLLPPGQGSYSLLRGSALRLEAVATKGLAQVALVAGGRDLQTLDLNGENSFQLTLGRDELESTTYGLRLTGSENLQAKQLTSFTIRLAPDLKPVVRAKLDGIGEMILPRAVVPVACRFRDDYAVTAAYLVRETGGLPGGKRSEERLEIPGLKPELGQRKFSYRHELEAAPLGLGAGMTLTFRVEAKDNDTIGGPNTGKSISFSLRVVTEVELRDEFLRREQELRHELERQLKEQQRLLENSHVVIAGGKGKARLPEAQRALLVKSEKRQRLLARATTALAHQFAQIFAEVRNNRLEPPLGPIQQRLRIRVLGPLGALIDGPLPRAAASLEKARQRAGKIESRDQSLSAAAAAQQRIVAVMQKILRHLVKSESYQGALNQVREILNHQREVNQETGKEQRKNIDDLFEK